MLVLHGIWRGVDNLCLWAEDSDLPPKPTRRPGRPPRQQAHPFAIPHDNPGEQLRPLTAKAAEIAVALLLPTRAGGPLASPELVRVTEPAATGSVTLRPWSIPMWAYGPDDALALLRRVAGDAGTGPTAARTGHRALDTGRIALGADLRHLCSVAEFAADLVVRGRLLPVVLPDGPRAAWRPVLTGADATWARSLALALPPAGRASADEPAAPASLVVARVLDSLVDAAARAALGKPAAAAKTARISGRGSRKRSALDAWRQALVGYERTFAADAVAVTALAADLASWQSEAFGTAVRGCFRLIEPEAPEEPPSDRTASSRTGKGWRLEFALQAAEEPSLLVDAEQVWRSRGALRALARHLDSPQETLLAKLGRANRIYPPLGEALRSARPAALPLDAAGAHRFLREGAPLLAGAGFGVLLPSWWSRPRARLGVRLSASTRTAPGTVTGTAALGLDSILDYKWELALGDEPLSSAELETLTRLKSSLVRLRGQWVELDPGRLEAGLKLLANGPSSVENEMTLGELLTTALAGEGGPGGLPVSAVTADGWLGDLLSNQVEHRLTPLPAPDGFHGNLRPYQERGLAWLAFLQSVGVGGILADDMGLGKTVQLLALLAADPPGAGPSLLVCPMSLVGNWQREAARFAPTLRVHVHHGAERARGGKFARAVAESDLVVTTYALAARDAAALAGIDWHRLILDEAQAIKNAATRQSAAVRTLPARHRIAVTGTPVENRLADLWSIMDSVNPKLLGSAAEFRRRYAEPIERHGDEEAAERLRRLTGPFVLRRVKTDRSVISDLPEKLEMEVFCNLTAEQASLYQAVVDDMLAKVEQSEGIERRGLVLATMTKLKQVCNHPAQLLSDGTQLAGRSGKLNRLEEVLDEVLAAGEKALLFTQYAQFGGMLRAHLSARFAREVAFLHGGVGKAVRDDLVARFQSDDGTGPPLFVLSLKAGGTGLTLTAANHVIHVDRWWNPAVEDQATDRAFRIGQRKTVQVRKFVCAGTVEEKISTMIRDKRGLAARIVSTGEQWLTELSTSELRNLVKLEAGAVVE